MRGGARRLSEPLPRHFYVLKDRFYVSTGTIIDGRDENPIKAVDLSPFRVDMKLFIDEGLARLVAEHVGGRVIRIKGE